MKDTFTELQVPFIKDEFMWKHLREYKVEKDEHTETIEDGTKGDDTGDD